MSETSVLSGGFFVHTSVPREAFPNLPALAERLGVSPNDGDMSVALHMNDGRLYSLFGLMNAFLDRMDNSLSE